MTFEAGKSGNPNGTPKAKRFYAALDRAICADEGKKLRAVADKLVDLAVAGEPFAMQMLADRLDGKAAQSVSISGDAENPLVLALIERRVIDPDGT